MENNRQRSLFLGGSLVLVAVALLSLPGLFFEPLGLPVRIVVQALLVIGLLGRVLRSKPLRVAGWCDSQYQHCTQVVEVTTSPYAVVDLRAAYKLTRNWQVALSVNNILNKRYYVSQNTPGLDLWYGDPRYFMLRIDAKF